MAALNERVEIEVTEDVQNNFTGKSIEGPIVAFHSFFLLAIMIFKSLDIFVNMPSAYQLPLSNNLIQNSLLKSQEVDIRNINSRDTLYYVE